MAPDAAYRLCVIAPRLLALKTTKAPPKRGLRVDEPRQRRRINRFRAR